MITLLRCMLALAAAFLLPLPTIAANVPPVFNAVTNRYAINGGVTIAITNTATDADVPAQSLTYSLLSAPLGATINAGDGVVTWTTTTNNAGTSNFWFLAISSGNGGGLTPTG